MSTSLPPFPPTVTHCDKEGWPSCYGLGFIEGWTHPGTEPPSGQHTEQFLKGYKDGASKSNKNLATQDPTHCDEEGWPPCYDVGFVGGWTHPGTEPPTGHSQEFCRGWEDGVKKYTEEGFGKGSGGIGDFKGELPYASELFGVFQPLVGWTGLLSLQRASRHGDMVKDGGMSKDKKKIQFTNPLLNSLINVHPFGGSIFLSPVGLMNLYREYFFEFDSFLGPPSGHVWLSPGGTVELIEVQTRKQIVERTIEQSTEITRKNEESLTEQDELSDAIKEDNQNNTKLGASVSGGVNFGIYHANASGSFNQDTARRQSSEQTHKHTRTQSEKTSSEVHSNFKTTFRTVTETTDTSTRRYVVQNTTDKLVNYELRRKMQKIGVQVQHLGTRLGWQVYLDYPGHPLGLGELVYTVPSSGSADNVKPPDPYAPPAPKDSDVKVFFPFMPSPNQTNEPHNDKNYIYDHGQPPETADLVRYPDDAGGDRLLATYTFTATPPALGYTLAGITETDEGYDLWPEFTIIPPNQFTVHIKHIHWGGKNSVNLNLHLSWNPPSESDDPGFQAYQTALDEYKWKVASAHKEDYVNAVRDRLKALSGIRPRALEDLRAEERSVVYAAVIQQLIPSGSNRHEFSELLRQIFDIDEMLYFVAPDYWLPQPIPSDPPTEAPPNPKYPPPVFPDPKDPPSLDGETILSWYGYQDKNNNIDIRGNPYVESRNNYLITEDTQPAPLGSSLGWFIQIDGDQRRNQFLNAAWVKAVLPVQPGKELEALAWLRDANVEGESDLSNPYQLQPGDPPEWGSKTYGEVLEILAKKLEDDNTNFNNTLATETVFQDGFDPLEGGTRVDAPPYEVFDQWIEVMPTDQIAAVEVKYDPKTGRQI